MCNTPSQMRCRFGGQKTAQATLEGAGLTLSKVKRVTATAGVRAHASREFGCVARFLHAPGPVPPQVLAWARDNLLQERPELFMKGATVKPGILVGCSERFAERTARRRLPRVALGQHGALRRSDIACTCSVLPAGAGE